MRATFSGLEIARRSLLAHRHALDVTGHNIANANAPGYSRQVAVLAATTPFASPGANAPTYAGQNGTGVEVRQVMRLKDEFVQQQINLELQAHGYWSSREELLRALEMTFLEPTESGIRNALDLFWQSFQELSKNPESQAARSVVRERAQVFADTIQSVYRQIDPLRRQLDSEIQARVGEINSIASQIAVINREISSVLASGGTPNDLYDERDRLIEQLSKIADITLIERPRGVVAIGIGGAMIVDGDRAREVVAKDADGDGFVELMLANTNVEVTVRSGELAALIEGRDVVLTEYMDKLNEFARAVIVRVNEVHNEGYGLNDSFDPNDYEPYNPGGGPPPAPPGRNFFKDASDDPKYLERAAEFIALSDDILQDAANIAASRNGAVGDGSNAVRLAQITHERILLGGTSTLNDFLASMVAGLGVQTEKAAQMVEHHEVLAGHLERLRSSVSGVSLDEELSNLIQFQHAYAAASRLVTAMDEAIDVIVNRMGLVGR